MAAAGREKVGWGFLPRNIDARQMVQASHRLASAARTTIARPHIGSTRQVAQSVFDQATPGAATSRPAGSSAMNISITRHQVHDGAVRLRVTGEVDLATSDLLAVTIRDAITAGHLKRLLVDLD